jgi:hypothetical protein
MVQRRTLGKLGSMLQAGSNLGSLVSNLQTQSGDLSSLDDLSQITNEATCLGAGGTWNKETGVCIGGKQPVGRPTNNLMEQKAKLLGE